MPERTATTRQQSIVAPPQRGSLLQRACACGNHTHGSGECESCRKNRMSLQRSHYGHSGDMAGQSVPPIVHEVLAKSGQPLDHATRESMESRFGFDFSNVRVHTGLAAQQSACEVNALAYTVGSNIVFAGGHYAPGESFGRHLLAHELTHVMQQAHAGPTPWLTIQTANDPGEDVAESTARRVTATPASLSMENQPRSSEGGFQNHQFSMNADIRRSQRPFQTLTRYGGFAAMFGPVRENDEVGSESGEKASTLIHGEVGKSIRKPGRMSCTPKSPRTQFLRKLPLPDRGDNVTATLLFNEVVFVEAEGKQGQEKDWYKITTSQGQEGWVPKVTVALDPPEPEALIYRIESGDKPINLVARWYEPKAGFEWGEDARFYVAALAFANKGRAGMPSPDNLNQLSAWKDVELIAGDTIWRPSIEFLRGLKGKVSSGSISKEIWEGVKKAAKRLLDWLIFAAAFIAGLLYGAGESIYDIFAGAVELISMVWKILKSLFTGNIISDAKGLWEDIKKIDLKGLAQDFLDKWNADDPWDSGFFQGRVVGYIVMEILIMIFSVGALTAIKWAGKFAKIGELIAKLPKVAKLAEAAKTATELPPKVLKFLKGRSAGKLDDAAALARGEGQVGKAASKSTRAAYLEKEGLEKAAQTGRASQKTRVVSPEDAAGFSGRQIRNLPRLLAKPLTSGELSILGQIWQQTAHAGDVAQLTLSNSRRLFNNHRRRFWAAVFDNRQARAMLRNAGLSFGQRRTAPFVTLADGRRIRITIDHIIERQTAPGRALDPANLRLMFERENTVLVRLINQLDPFQ